MLETHGIGEVGKKWIFETSSAADAATNTKQGTRNEQRATRNNGLHMAVAIRARSEA